MASAILGGFGGFLAEAFRRHDFYLGRRNCQAFLRWHFALPETNRLFDGFAARDRWYVTETDGHRETFRSRREQRGRPLSADYSALRDGRGGHPEAPLPARE